MWEEGVNGVSYEGTGPTESFPFPRAVAGPDVAWVPNCREDSKLYLNSYGQTKGKLSWTRQYTRVLIPQGHV